MARMKKSFCFGLLTVLAGTICLMMCIHSAREALRATRPPQGEVTLTAFLASGKQICCIQDITVNDKTYTVVIGVMHTTLLLLPSGPPAYIFDERHILVDWCGDIGDNPGFIKKWGGFKHDKQTHQKRGETSYD